MIVALMMFVGVDGSAQNLKMRSDSCPQGRFGLELIFLVVETTVVVVELLFDCKLCWFGWSSKVKSIVNFVLMGQLSPFLFLGL